MRASATLALLSLAAVASADDVYLVGGGKVTGEIVERTDRGIVVETGPGRVTVPLARVKRVEARRSTLGEFRQRASALKPGDVEGWIELGRWAEARDLGTQASEAYRRALAGDPANAEANRALGRTQVDGRWITREEHYREQGLVEFEGHWVTPGDRESTLRERSAADAASRSGREAEARVREAEARARAAEAEARRAEAEAGAAQDQSEGLPYYPYVYPGGGAVILPQPVVTPTPEPTPRPTPAPPTPVPTSSIDGSSSDQPDGNPAPVPAPRAIPRGSRKR